MKQILLILSLILLLSCNNDFIVYKIVKQDKVSSQYYFKINNTIYIISDYNNKYKIGDTVNLKNILGKM